VAQFNIVTTVACDSIPFARESSHESDSDRSIEIAAQVRFPAGLTNGTPVVSPPHEAERDTEL
jgi:hypothetical protein